jgi:hypothetical protein
MIGIGKKQYGVVGIEGGKRIVEMHRPPLAGCTCKLNLSGLGLYIPLHVALQQIINATYDMPDYSI